LQVLSSAIKLLKFIVGEFMKENPGVVEGGARALAAATFDALISRVGDTVHVISPFGKCRHCTHDPLLP
jgi:hypothetical protein